MKHLATEMTTWHNDICRSSPCTVSNVQETLFRKSNEVEEKHYNYYVMCNIHTFLKLLFFTTLASAAVHSSFILVIRPSQLHFILKSELEKSTCYLYEYSTCVSAS